MVRFQHYKILLYIILKRALFVCFDKDWESNSGMEKSMHISCSFDQFFPNVFPVTSESLMTQNLCTTQIYEDLTIHFMIPLFVKIKSNFLS